LKGKGISQRSPLGLVGIFHLLSKDGVTILEAIIAGYIAEDIVIKTVIMRDKVTEVDEKLKEKLLGSMHVLKKNLLRPKPIRYPILYLQKP